MIIHFADGEWWIDATEEPQEEREANMSKLIDSQAVSPTQAIDIYEDGHMWLHDNGTRQDIELDALAATTLYDFLLLHMDRIHRHAQAQRKP